MNSFPDLQETSTESIIYWIGWFICSDFVSLPSLPQFLLQCISCTWCRIWISNGKSAGWYPTEEAHCFAGQGSGLWCQDIVGVLSSFSVLHAEDYSTYVPSVCWTLLQTVKIEFLKYWYSSAQKYQSVAELEGDGGVIWEEACKRPFLFGGIPGRGSKTFPSVFLLPVPKWLRKREATCTLQRDFHQNLVLCTPSMLCCAVLLHCLIIFQSQNSHVLLFGL